MTQAKKKINSKAKGSGYELKIAKLLSEWWGEEFHRTPASGGLNWHKDNRVTGDIVTPPDSVFPFSIECKKREEFMIEQLLKGSGDIEKWWSQSVRDADKVELKPLLIFAKNFSPNYAMMNYVDFMEMINHKEHIGFSYFIIHKPGQPTRVICILDEFISEVSKEDVMSAFKL